MYLGSPSYTILSATEFLLAVLKKGIMSLICIKYALYTDYRLLKALRPTSVPGSGPFLLAYRLLA